MALIQTPRPISAARARWVAQAGSQALFLSSPIFETLYEGTRGPGKTESLLMDFAQHCGQGYGASWRGILFRQTYKQLDDVITKTKKWFPLLFPGVEFNEAKTTWRWPTGEELLLRYIANPKDYWNYHGHEYPWIGFEELTSWATPECYLIMMSCCRSSHPTMPRKYRATTNPYGKGHNWVKRRFKLPHMRGRIIKTAGEPDRIAIHGHLHENKVLMAAEPDYESRIRASASNPAQAEAWLTGSWDITSGGMFDDLWMTQVHALDPFSIPREWSIDRSFDWGQSKPFSVGWWAQSNGSPVVLPSRRVLSTVRGDLFRIGEWYGCQKDRDNTGLRMLATDIADGIRLREAAMGIAGRVKPGPADSSIFDEENGNCIATDMASRGVHWEKADKSPGSRKQGWLTIRKLLKGAANIDEEGARRSGPREHKGLFVFKSCEDWIRTVPPITRSDADPDDVDTDVEDHAADETRYRARYERRVIGSGNF